MALEIEIGADSSGFDKKIKEIEKDIQDLSNIKLNQIKLGLDTKEIDGNIKSAKQALSDLKNSLKDTGNSFSAITPKVANGGNALMQFSRIAQDAPFGIMGIGNNITATVEAFGNLRQSTGSTGGALKALGSSMLGSGGILLAVSLVTSGLTYMAQSGLTVNDVFQKITGTFDESARAMQKINEESIKGSAQQIAQMNAYVSVAQNVNLSMSDRLIAVKKLQDEYPAYFGNLSKEQILNGNVEASVKAVTSALIAKAKAAGFSEKIASLAEQEFKLRQEEKKQIESLKKTYKSLNDQKGKASAIGGVSGGGGIGGQLAIEAQRKSLKDIQDQIKQNIKEQKAYTAEIEKQTAASIKLEQSKPKVIKAVKQAKAPNITPQVSDVTGNLGAQGLEDLSGRVVQIAKGVQGAEGVITTSMGNIRTVYDSSLLGMLEMMKSFNDEMNSLVTGSITDTFNSLGDAIGSALANGGNVFSAIGNTLLQSMGSFLSDMGGLLIKYGTLAVVKGKLDLAIATGGPLSIGAGLAAIAVGVALKAAGGAIGSRASSGASGGSSNVSTGANYSSPASGGSYSSGGFAGGKVVFEISGQSLIGVLSNTLEKNTRLGGRLSIN